MGRYPRCHARGGGCQFRVGWFETLGEAALRIAGLAITSSRQAGALADDFERPHPATAQGTACTTSCGPPFRPCDGGTRCGARRVGSHEEATLACLDL